MDANIPASPETVPSPSSVIEVFQSSQWLLSFTPIHAATKVREQKGYEQQLAAPQYQHLLSAGGDFFLLFGPGFIHIYRHILNFSNINTGT